MLSSTPQQDKALAALALGDAAEALRLSRAVSGAAKPWVSAFLSSNCEDLCSVFSLLSVRAPLSLTPSPATSISLP